MGQGDSLDTLGKRKISCPCQQSNYDSLGIQPAAVTVPITRIMIAKLSTVAI
jgi:hypothetical protein